MGDANVNVIGANFNTNAALNKLGRYKFDGGYLNGTAIPLIDCGPTNGTAIVGSYLPNAWSLYDMHGNVLEWCLDWYLAALPGGTDPRGAATGTMRMVRGGCWSWEAGYCRSAYRYYYTPSDKLNNVGFRLVLTLP